MKTIKTEPAKRWAVLWRTKFDEYIMWYNGKPLLFRTKTEAQDYILENHAYIRTCRDLRESPYYWRMPQAVKVDVIIRRC